MTERRQTKRVLVGPSPKGRWMVLFPQLWVYGDDEKDARTRAKLMLCEWLNQLEKGGRSAA